MKATLSPKVAYEISINGIAIGVFHRKSTWNGMEEFRRDTDSELLIIKESDSLPKALSFLDPDGSSESEIVAASFQIMKAIGATSPKSC